jgi:hypothetical protein
VSCIFLAPNQAINLIHSDIDFYLSSWLILHKNSVLCLSACSKREYVSVNFKMLIIENVLSENMRII